MVTPEQDAFEHDADRLAQTVLSGRQAEPVAHRPGPAVQRQPLPPTSPGPPTMQGPDWGGSCDFSKWPPECSGNTPAGDVPIEKDYWRCVALAYEGRCPPECEDKLQPRGIPCVQRQRPRPPGSRPPIGGPECPPGQIPIQGKCIPFRRPESTPPPPTGGATSQKCPPDQIPTITGGCSPARSSTSTPSGPAGPERQFQLEPPAAPHARFGTIESETLDNFALNDPHVPEQYAAQLDHLAGLLNVYREVEVHIEGHTDGSGTEGINVPLSQQRAEAVKAKLIARHVVNPARLKTQGFSSHQPQVPPSTPTAQEPRNRRVEIWYHIAPSQLPGEGLRMRTNP
jgi:outer membrane protein OmpA-like peptidoglycan-associated protein